MIRNKILDYEQVQDILQKITEKDIIKEEENLGNTEYGLPIKHYITGNGKQDIVITGATHGCEIITTDFIVRLMNEISTNPEKWKNILDNFKIHFIPILNPEGYLISTSAIRILIPRNMEENDAERLCNEYYKIYREDNIDKINNQTKRHQKMFEGVDYNCIPAKYPKIRDSIKNIMQKYPDLPNSVLHTWSANASGIDIQANCKYNPVIDRILKNEEIFMKSSSYNNIEISHPGPINCPFDKEKGFRFENETIAIANLLEKLNSKGKLFAYFNYHSTGGIIYQRPSTLPKNLEIPKEEILKKEIINYMFSKIYSEKTYKDIRVDEDEKDKSKYVISGVKNETTSNNDIFRLMYPRDLLIELSAMGGNPIAPYGDIKGNYTNTMNCNLQAIKYTLEVSSIAQMICDAIFKNVSKFEENQDYEKIVELENIIYKEFEKRVKQLENSNIKKEDCKGYER